MNNHVGTSISCMKVIGAQKRTSNFLYFHLVTDTYSKFKIYKRSRKRSWFVRYIRVTLWLAPKTEHWPCQCLRSAMRTKRTCADAAIADAAFFREFGTRNSIMRWFSPNRLFNRIRTGRLQTTIHAFYLKVLFAIKRWPPKLSKLIVPIFECAPTG